MLSLWSSFSWAALDRYSTTCGGGFTPPPPPPCNASEVATPSSRVPFALRCKRVGPSKASAHSFLPPEGVVSAVVVLVLGGGEAAGGVASGAGGDCGGASGRFGSSAADWAAASTIGGEGEGGGRASEEEEEEEEDEGWDSGVDPVGTLLPLASSDEATSCSASLSSGGTGDANDASAATSFSSAGSGGVSTSSVLVASAAVASEVEAEGDSGGGGVSSEAAGGGASEEASSLVEGSLPGIVAATSSLLRGEGVRVALFSFAAATTDSSALPSSGARDGEGLRVAAGGAEAAVSLLLCHFLCHCAANGFAQRLTTHAHAATPHVPAATPPTSGALMDKGNALEPAPAVDTACIECECKKGCENNRIEASRVGVLLLFIASSETKVQPCRDPQISYLCRVRSRCFSSASSRKFNFGEMKLLCLAMQQAQKSEHYVEA